jgi:hypothetical protein
MWIDAASIAGVGSVNSSGTGGSAARLAAPATPGVIRRTAAASSAVLGFRLVTEGTFTEGIVIEGMVTG